MTKTAQNGDWVTVTYDGLLSTGEVFESSADQGPLQFQLGDGSVFKGFAEAIVGLVPGQTATFTLPPEATHGPHQPELVQTIPRTTMPGGVPIQAGMVIGMTLERDGQAHQVPALVTAVSGDQMTVDFNHPLAGQHLTYTVTLVRIDPEPALA